MSVEQIADAVADREHWLKVRRNYLTSSEVFTWRGDFEGADWWPETREGIIKAKLAGEEKTFDDESTTSMWHGSFDEGNILNKFGVAAGVGTRAQNSFWVNSRWPMLGASIDGFGSCLTPRPPVIEVAAQNRQMMQRIQNDLYETADEFLVEIKKSTSTKWQTQVPEYYITQVQTQLAITERPLAVIVAETIAPGRRQKWRKYWDLRAYVIRPNPQWERVMDELNDEAFEAFGNRIGEVNVQR